MVIIKAKGKSASSKWKALQLNESVVSNGIEGLIGIEELTNYTLIQKKRKKNCDDPDDDEDFPEPQIKTIKVNVRKKTELVANEKETSETATELDPLAKKKKKRNPNRNKNKRKKAAADTLEQPIDDEITSGSGTSTTNQLVPKKNATKKVNKKLKRLNANEAREVDNLSIAGSSKSINKAASLPETLTSQLTIKTKKPKNLKIKKGNVLISSDSSTFISDMSNKIKGNAISKLKMSKKEKKRQNILKKEVTIVPEDTEKSDDESVVEEDNEEQSKKEKLLGPIQGMEGWAGLNLPDSILRALSEKGFKEPTEIQALSLPAALLGRRDIMGAAETGSGKTLAFGIPIIYGILQQKNRDMNASESPVLDDDADSVDNEIEEAIETEEPEVSDSESESSMFGLDEDGIGCVRVIDNIDFDDIANNDGQDVITKPVNPLYNHKLYALILTPTRELAIQVKDHLVAAAKYTGIRVAVVIGGLAPQKQERLLKTKPEIVVATPGRLWELIQEGNPHLQQVDDISYLAIDETDRMIEKGHFQELQELLQRINVDEAKKKHRQNFVFSATLTMVHEPPPRKNGKKQMRVTPGQKLQDVIKMLGISHPKVVDVTRKSGTAQTLEEAVIRCTFDEKDIYLYYFLIRHPGRTLIFCNSISCVRRLAQLLTILQCKPLPIHANMVQRQRLRNLDKFRANPTGLLLATDVAARGLDIPDVQHVIHYQVPRTSEGYVHRSGRTARASKQGLTLLLIEPEEQQAYSRLCRTLGKDQKLPSFEVSEDLMTAARQRVRLARDVDQLELTSRRSDADLGWFQKALTDMDMVLDKDDLPMRISEEETVGNRKVASGKRKQLELLLSRPLFSSRR